MEPTKQTNEIITHILEALESPSKPLTKWEESFISSVSDQFDRRGSLSARQFETLERIYAEKTD